MKTYKFFIGALLLGLTSCSDTFIEIDPQSYITESVYFSNKAELNIALNACYAGMRAPAAEEWKFTELRSDNSCMNLTSTTSADNFLFSSYDTFYLSTNDPNLTNYWYYTYVNIKNNNILLDKMNVNYSGGSIVYGANDINATAADIKDVAAQACFLRAYHYFNLVRLFGDVFLVHEPVNRTDAAVTNRVNKSLTYDLIIADLLSSIANGSTTKYTVASAATGKANVWAAKALLAKVYLTLNRKADALPLLKDVIANSGYDLESSYANVFSTSNELNKEILFTIRYKSGNIGLGSPFTCDFAPSYRTNNIVVTAAQGDNAATAELYNSFKTNDARFAFVSKSDEPPTTQTPQKYFFSKFQAAQSVRNDSEYDFPIIRFADVLLMYAEAAGSADSNTLTYINRVRTRAGLSASPIVAADIDSPTKFDLVVANERRWEFTGENQRWFDLLRYKTTLPTLDPVNILLNHFNTMQPLLYSFYQDGKENVTTAVLQARITTDRLLLPIPQLELDTNNTITIPQNTGYN